MKYRLITESDEITVVIEDGGIACIRAAEPVDDKPRTAVTDYYHTRITSIDPADNLYEQLAEGDMSCTDWPTESFDSHEVLQDALQWLAVGNTDWEQDNNLFLEYEF